MSKIKIYDLIEYEVCVSVASNDCVDFDVAERINKYVKKGMFLVILITFT